MQFGYFTMPSHPPERSLKDGHEWDLQVIRWLDELGYTEAWIGEHHTAPWEPHPSPDLLVAQALMDGDLLADPSDLVLVEPLFRHHLCGHLGARIAKIRQPDRRRRTLSKQCVAQLNRWLRLARRLLGCCPLTWRSLGWRSLGWRSLVLASIALRSLLLLEALA